MPETHDEEGQEKRERRISRPNEQGIIEIVSHPMRKRDVPTIPELDGVSREVRKIEILLESNPEHQRKTAGHVGIT